jgi:hypothetical protein
VFEPTDGIVSTLAGGKGWIGSTDLGHTPLRPSPVLAPASSTRPTRAGLRLGWSRPSGALWGVRASLGVACEKRGHEVVKRSGITSAFGRPLRVLGGLVTVALVVGFGLSSASASTKGGLTRSSWSMEIAHLPVPQGGCYSSSYPALAWQRVQCHSAPDVPFAPHVSAGNRSQGPGETIGDGSDYSAVVTSGRISTATGTFPYISPGSTEKGQYDDQGAQVANTYSLQLNTEFFSGSPACDKAAAPSKCLAWQQFVYSSHGNYVFMQYWLIDYDASCPSAWITYSYKSDGETITDCYANSTSVELSSKPSASELPTVSLTGTAAANGHDSIVMDYDGSSASAVGADSKVDLADEWTTAEFDIFGDAGGGVANFSSNTTLDVKTSINNGATSAPACDEEGFTAETNNLSFAGAPTLTVGSQPSVETQQTSNGGTPGCASDGTKTNVVSVSNPGNQDSTSGAAVSLRLEGTDSVGPQSLKWSATGAPSGLSISSGGIISGKPTKAGTSFVTVKATDTSGATGVASFSWVVKNKVTVTNPGKKTTAVGSSVRLQLRGTDSARGQRLKWSASRLPPGLTITSSGKVTGKPKKAGTSTVTVTAKDSSGAKGRAKFTWVIKAR